MENSKIRISKTGKELEIHIDQSIEKKHVTIIGIWLALWTLCGAVILFSLFLPAPRETKLMTIVFLTFWAYFESAVYSAYRWKKNGSEKLSVKDGLMEIKSSGRKDKVYSVSVDKIKELILAPENKFRNSMNSSFWNIGEPALFVKTNERSIGFGRQLTKEDAVKIEKVIRTYIR